MAPDRGDQTDGIACSCPTPLPVERATRKGAAQTECLRCGRPIPIRLTPGRRRH